ncbi:U1 small nuclear ribonucleoprotein C [Phakopsora pachyrhizi]|uniref:U1 small nuclear ribonucleo protein C n=1 Tax=Phakopsora pachyrhizi TaxID=170000 RepID=A0AAV0BRZ5_PHAPC|nr:U1 small nuclear ribonucleoprotein C [Phakopsora pachyrhizi]CAH7689226.1 U1 small nuclear ribonucleo protein C [Phakopsora pachyrhizi]
MGKYYCDYCGYPSVRKAHNSGRNHLTNVRDYYSSLGHDKAQVYIDEITRMFEVGGSSSGNRGGGGGVGAGRGGGGVGSGYAGGNPGVRPPFQAGGVGPPSMPPFPPAMMALINGTNKISSPGTAPPPMRFAGPPIINNTASMSQPPPPGLNGYPGSQPHISSGPQPNPGNQPGPPPLIGGMNPDRARQLGLL